MAGSTEVETRFVMTERGWRIEINIPDDFDTELLNCIVKDTGGLPDQVDAVFFEREELKLFEQYYDGTIDDASRERLFNGPWAEMRRRRRLEMLRMTGREIES